MKLLHLSICRSSGHDDRGNDYSGPALILHIGPIMFFIAVEWRDDRDY